MSTTQTQTHTTTTPQSINDETNNAIHDNDEKLLKHTVHRAKEKLSRVRVLVYRYFHQAVHATQLSLSHARQVIHEATKYDEEEEAYEHPPQLQECDISESSHDGDNDDDDDSLDIIPMNKQTLLNRTVDATKTSLHHARQAIHNATKSVEEKEKERVMKGTLSEQDEIHIRQKLLLNNAIRASKNGLVRVRDIVHEVTRKEKEEYENEDTVLDIFQQKQQHDDEDINKSLLIKAVHVTKSQLDHVREVIHDATKPSDNDDKEDVVSLEEGEEQVSPAENLFHSPHPDEEKNVIIIMHEVLPLNTITDNTVLNDDALVPSLYDEIDDDEEKEKEEDDNEKVLTEEEQPEFPSNSNDANRLQMLLHAMD